MPLQARGIRELIDYFGRLDGEIEVAAREGATAAADLIAEQVRSNYGWSPEIAGSVQTSAKLTLTGGAQVRVPERGYPHAGEVRTLEGNGVSPTTFRHRVYGSDNWVSMETRPSFWPAVEERRDAAEALIETAVMSAFE